MWGGEWVLLGCCWAAEEGYSGCKVVDDKGQVASREPSVAA